jgi:hypothetical protein
MHGLLCVRAPISASNREWCIAFKWQASKMAQEISDLVSRNNIKEELASTKVLYPLCLSIILKYTKCTDEFASHC